MVESEFPQAFALRLRVAITVACDRWLKEETHEPVTGREVVAITVACNGWLKAPDTPATPGTAVAITVFSDQW